MKRIILLCVVLCLSLAAAANAALTGSLGGTPFKPTEIRMCKADEITSEAGVTVDLYRLDFWGMEGTAIRQIADITIAVPKGNLPDGRTFRSSENTETEKQPAAAKGVPEVQNWSLVDRNTGFTNPDRPANIKLELGKRKDETISGKINLSLTPGPNDEEGMKPSTLTGDFKADIRECAGM